MENEDTVYKDDNEESFIEYVFSNKPQEKGVIKLECGLPENDKPFPKHMYEQLLQIFTDGMKYLYSDNEKGSVHVYKNNSGTWESVGQIDGEANYDRSGSSVEISDDGSTIAIGAPWNDGGGNKSGHVRVYQIISND